MGGIDTKTISTAWTRVAAAVIAAVNAAHRRILVIAPHVLRAVSSIKAYLIGIPLAIAIPALGIFVGLRLAKNPQLVNDKSPVVGAVVNAALFLLTVFFTGVKRFGLLGTLAIAGFILLAIFLLCARLIGANVLAVFRRQPNPKRIRSTNRIRKLLWGRRRPNLPRSQDATHGEHEEQRRDDEVRETQ